MSALFNILGIISVYTLWLTPFTFIFFLVSAIKSAVKGKEYFSDVMISGISLFFLLVPSVYNMM